MGFRLYRFDLLVTLGCIALLCFFAWHAGKGPRGYAFLGQLNAKAEMLEQTAAAEGAEKARLETKVALMRPEGVDPDMLEELARQQLELSRRNELIVRIQN